MKKKTRKYIISLFTCFIACLLVYGISQQSRPLSVSAETGTYGVLSYDSLADGTLEITDCEESVVSLFQIMKLFSRQGLLTKFFPLPIIIKKNSFPQKTVKGIRCGFAGRRESAAGVSRRRGPHEQLIPESSGRMQQAGTRGCVNGRSLAGGLPRGALASEQGWYHECAAALVPFEGTGVFIFTRRFWHETVISEVPSL